MAEDHDWDYLREFWAGGDDIYHSECPQSLSEIDNSIHSEETAAAAGPNGATENEIDNEDPNQQAADQPSNSEEDEEESVSSQDLRSMDVTQCIAAAKECVCLRPRGGRADSNLFRWFRMCAPLSDRKLNSLKLCDVTAHDMF